MVGYFEHHDVEVIGINRGEHETKCGCVQSLVDFVSEGLVRHKASVCAYKVDREAGVEEGLTEEQHVIISRRSVNGS